MGPLGTMAECVGYVSLTPSMNHGESGFVSEPDVVFVAWAKAGDEVMARVREYDAQRD